MVHTHERETSTIRPRRSFISLAALLVNVIASILHGGHGDFINSGSIFSISAFVRFLAVGWMADKEGIEPLADVCAAAFRLIDHSSFDRNAAALLESMGVRSAENMARLTLI